MKPNNYAMKDWHLEHVEKVILRFIRGISPDASSLKNEITKDIVQFQAVPSKLNMTSSMESQQMKC
jgi:hypothetical protein